MAGGGWNLTLVLERIRRNDDTLTKVNLRSRNIGDTGAKLLSDALAHNNTVDVLNLYSNNIGDDGVQHIAAEFLRANSTLKALVLAQNKIRIAGALHLADVLRTNAALQELDLDSNMICGAGTLHLADALRSNTKLRKLDLARNNIGHKGALHLANALRTNSTLQELELAVNNVCNEGTLHLADALKTNKGLHCLDLTGNEIGAKGALHLADALRINVTLQRLDLHGNKISGKGTKHLADALRINTTLQLLNLIVNEVRDEGALHLVDALLTNTTLQQLDLDSNDISGELDHRIKGMVHSNNVKMKHEEGVDEEGVHYFISYEAPYGIDSSVKSKPGYMKWEDNRVREAACSGDGRALSGLLRILRWVVEGCGMLEDDKPGTFSIASGDLVPNMKNPEARKALADTWLNDKEKYTVLHLAAAAEADCALQVCQILVDKFGADFDNIKDSSGRSARTIALANSNSAMIAWASSVGTLLGRYRVDKGPPIHKSATCKVVSAIDITEEVVERRRVALKIVEERIHFEQELKTRLVNLPGSGKDICPSFIRFAEAHTVKIYRYHDEKDEHGKHTMCLVMPMADRSLDDIIRAEDVAGRELLVIRHFALNIAKALMHLHSDQNIVHGDLKPRNAVRMGSGLKLIDFDSSVQVGKTIGMGKLSTAYCPPEFAKFCFHRKENLQELETKCDVLKADLEFITTPVVRKHAQKELEATEEKIEYLQSGEVEPPKADPTFDIWSFGVIMYYLLTGSCLFKCNSRDCLDGTEEKQALIQWQGLHTDQLRLVLQNCSGVSPMDMRNAKDLLTRCLMPNPVERPSSMAEVISMPFLMTSAEYEWTPLMRNSIRVLFSDPLVWEDINGGLHPIERLNFLRERKLLVDSLKKSQKNIDLSFDPATDTRLQELAAARCGCLHFSGHGNPGYLLFENGFGGAHFLDVDGLLKLLKPFSEPFRFVFVSACHSEHIGQAFISTGVRHVVCAEHESRVLDDAAADFIRTFYSALAAGQTVKVAFLSAKGTISVTYGEGESAKFLLLPTDVEHDVSVLDADSLQWHEDVKVGRPFPAPPVDFSGKEIIMHGIISAILTEKRLVTLVGEKIIDRSRLISAVCHYIKDRLNTALNVDDLFFVRRETTKGGHLDGSLLFPFHKQLAAEGKAENSSKKNLSDSICEALNGLKVLIVFDGVDELESAMRVFLENLFAVTESVRVLLSSGQPTNISSFAATEAVFTV